MFWNNDIIKAERLALRFLYVMVSSKPWDLSPNLFKDLGALPQTLPPGQVLFATQKAACGVRTSLRYLLKRVDLNFNSKFFNDFV